MSLILAKRLSGIHENVGFDTVKKSVSSSLFLHKGKKTPGFLVVLTSTFTAF